MAGARDETLGTVANDGGVGAGENSSDGGSIGSMELPSADFILILILIFFFLLCKNRSSC